MRRHLLGNIEKLLIKIIIYIRYR